MNEALWSKHGTVLAAIHLAEDTGEARWAALVREAADALLVAMVPDDDTGTLWVQPRYGRPAVRYLGAGHGLAGNVYPFLRAAALSPAGQVQTTSQRTLERCRPRRNAFLGVNPQRPAHWLPPVQDCHGASHVVGRMANSPRTPDWRRLLFEAASICHGTAGSALAKPKLRRRRGDTLLLDRARALAMHAVGQVKRHRAAFGCGCQSLWTGDLGLASVLQNCVAEDDAFPKLDAF